MPEIHFANFLGLRHSSICGIANVPDEQLTLVPTAVTCALCLKSLGRLQSDGFGIPRGKKPKDDGST